MRKKSKTITQEVLLLEELKVKTDIWDWVHEERPSSRLKYVEETADKLDDKLWITVLGVAALGGLGGAAFALFGDVAWGWKLLTMPLSFALAGFLVGLITAGVTIGLVNWRYAYLNWKLERRTEKLVPDEVPQRMQVLRNLRLLAKATQDPDLQGSYGDEARALLQAVPGFIHTSVEAEKARCDNRTVPDDINNALNAARNSLNDTANILERELDKLTKEREERALRLSMLGQKELQTAFDVETFTRAASTAREVEKLRKELEATYPQNSIEA